MATNFSPFVTQIVEADADDLPSNGRIGIIDIGSNTVRLVVYDAPARLPVPVFNERVSCRLGKGLGKFGKLNPKGVELAFRSLKRFTNLAREMQVESFVMLATAAVREATDGAEFAAEVERRFGYPVQVLELPKPVWVPREYWAVHRMLTACLAIWAAAVLTWWRWTKAILATMLHFR